MPQNTKTITSIESFSLLLLQLQDEEDLAPYLVQLLFTTIIGWCVLLQTKYKGSAFSIYACITINENSGASKKMVGSNDESQNERWRTLSIAPPGKHPHINPHYRKISLLVSETGRGAPVECDCLSELFNVAMVIQSFHR